MKLLAEIIFLASALGLHAQNCTFPYTAFQTGCYKLEHRKSVNWWQAAEACRDEDAVLVVINNAFENNVIFQMTRNIHVEDFWLGGYDSGHEGKWVWESNRQLVTFTSWDKGQPDNNGSANCMSIHYQDNYRGWMDDPCSKNASYICEKIPPPNCNTSSPTIPPTPPPSKECGCQLVVQPCPPRFVQLASNCYLFSGNLRSDWYKAWDICRQFDSKLSYPQSQKALVALQEYVANNFPQNEHWIQDKFNCSRLYGSLYDYNVAPTCCEEKLPFICQTVVNEKYQQYIPQENNQFLYTTISMTT